MGSLGSGVWEMKVRSEKVKLPKGKNEDEREPESEENHYRTGSGLFRSCSFGLAVGGHAALPPNYCYASPLLLSIRTINLNQTPLE